MNKNLHRRTKTGNGAVYTTMKERERSDNMDAVIGKIDFEVPAGLSGRIIAAIERRQRKAVMARAVFYLATSVLAAALFAFTWRSVSLEFDRTGASQLLSLAFSDFRSVVLNWGDYSTSVMEALPVAPVIYALLSTAVLLSLISAAMENVKKINRIINHYSTRNHVGHA